MRGGGRKGTVESSSDPQMPLGVDRLFLRDMEVPRVCKLHPDQVIAILSATEVSSSVPILPLGPQDGILGVVLQALGGGRLGLPGVGQSLSWFILNLSFHPTAPV